MAIDARRPVSRRERPAKPALTREGIVATAIGVMRAEGLEKATMRRLAQELDTGPASLYVYFRNSSELYGAILDELLETIDMNPATDASQIETAARWRDQLIQILTSYLMVLFEYPSLARAALVTRPSGPGYLGLFEKLLALLNEGGVSLERAGWAADMLLQYATTNAAEHSTRDEAADCRDQDAAMAAALATVPAETYPHLAALGVELMSGDGPDRLRWGFDVLINGILSTPRPRSVL